jgi:hypothetical protein
VVPGSIRTSWTPSRYPDRRAEVPSRRMTRISTPLRSGRTRSTMPRPDRDLGSSTRVLVCIATPPSSSLGGVGLELGSRMAGSPVFPHGGPTAAGRRVPWRDAYTRGGGQQRFLWSWNPKSVRPHPEAMCRFSRSWMRRIHRGVLFIGSDVAISGSLWGFVCLVVCSSISDSKLLHVRLDATYCLASVSFIAAAHSSLSVSGPFRYPPAFSWVGTCVTSRSQPTLEPAGT